MGAWIETSTLPTKSMSPWVAPLVGAWIETDKSTVGKVMYRVAPLVGAWIETTMLPTRWKKPPRSLPSWERGLKLWLFNTDDSTCMSLPSWERGLKLRGGWYVHRRGERRSPRGSVD